MRRSRLSIFSFCAFAAATSSAFAGAHTWRIAEIFTNASGTVQFVELMCVSGSGENFVGGLQVTTGTNTFTFPGNLVGSTLNKRVLLGTAAYAALPGATAPDYTIPSNFFAVGGGFTIRYNPGGNYDSNVVGAGIIPTDGIHSLTWTTFNGGNTADTFDTDVVNSPQNFGGGTGAVGIPTVSEWGVLVMALLTLTAGSVMLRQRS